MAEIRQSGRPKDGGVLVEKQFWFVCTFLDGALVQWDMLASKRQALQGVARPDAASDPPGGPPAYSQSCGDESAVLQIHAGNGDMGDLGERFLRCFDRAADDAELPADPAFRAALLAYMRWAVEDVLSYAAEDAVVAQGAVMPRWGWDGLQT